MEARFKTCWDDIQSMLGQIFSSVGEQVALRDTVSFDTSWK